MAKIKTRQNVSEFIVDGLTVSGVLFASILLLATSNFVGNIWIVSILIGFGISFVKNFILDIFIK